MMCYKYENAGLLTITTSKPKPWQKYGRMHGIEMRITMTFKLAITIILSVFITYN